MDFSKILSIGGKPGLYKMIATTRNGFIVESLLDGKRAPAFASQKISSLDEISIFAADEEVKLADVFKNIFEKTEGGMAPDAKQSEHGEIISFFAEILPDYDEDLVKVSDMKKVFKWYNLLMEKEMLDFNKEEEQEQTPEEEQQQSAEQKAEDKKKPVEKKEKKEIPKK